MERGCRVPPHFEGWIGGWFGTECIAFKGASGITFEAFGASIGAGGFQVTWFKDHAYIGHGEFYGAGVSLGTPGGGTGTLS